MKKSLILILMLATLLAAQTFKVTVEGFGIDEKSATDDAKRNAIEQALGVAITSSTEVSNYMLVKDVIASEAKGELISFKILSRSDDGVNKKVQIEAEVAKDKLAAEVRRLDAVRTAMKDPSILVFFGIGGDKKNDASYDRHVRKSVDDINSYLQDRKFRTFDLEQLIASIKKTKSTADYLKVSDDDLRDLADRENAELFARVEVDYVPDGKTGYFKLICKLLSSTSGALIATAEGRSNKIMLKDGILVPRDFTEDDINDAVNKAMKSVISKIFIQFSKASEEGRIFKVFLNDLPDGLLVNNKISKMMKANTASYTKISNSEFEVNYKGASLDEFVEQITEELVGAYGTDKLSIKTERDKINIYKKKK